MHSQCVYKRFHVTKFQYFLLYVDFRKYRAYKNFYIVCLFSVNQIHNSRFLVQTFCKRLTGVFGLYVSIDRSRKQQNLVTFKRTRARFSVPRFCPRAWIAGNFVPKEEHQRKTTLVNENELRYMMVCVHKETLENVGRVAPFMFTAALREKVANSFINNWMPNVKSASKIHEFCYEYNQVGCTHIHKPNYSWIHIGYMDK